MLFLGIDQLARGLIVCLRFGCRIVCIFCLELAHKCLKSDRFLLNGLLEVKSGVSPISC
ncbi:hypothetical protein Pan54_23080 [Rubinisphaera italica]|uniref:Uncharacterized protein n=1 Tax=Rubinisphaera italica TaxID=2527969 RepID=A0A5C5XID3_9PLAN|nr:hypothetical protein Pan54_23080 [Rubinisphaera italica]